MNDPTRPPPIRAKLIWGGWALIGLAGVLFYDLLKVAAQTGGDPVGLTFALGFCLFLISGVVGSVFLFRGHTGRFPGHDVLAEDASRVRSPIARTLLIYGGYGIITLSVLA